MRNVLNVRFKLDRLVCYEEADGWGSAEPYMWTVFFKIDGTTCRLNDALMLEGTATIFTTPGSHGNLGDTDVDAGDTVSIPLAIGAQTMTLTPIPVPDWVKESGTDDVAAIAGCIVVLMEEDNVTDDGANAGHDGLNLAIQSALDGIIPTLGFTNQDITDEELEALTLQVEEAVKQAISDQQNVFENIWSWLNADDTVGTVVWKFSGDTLLEEGSIPLVHRWPNEQHPSTDHGVWEIFANVDAVEIPTCPAEVVRDIFERVAKGSSDETMRTLRDFRSKELTKYGGIGLWWQLARRNSHLLKKALMDKEVAAAAVTIFKDAPGILAHRDRPISDSHFDSALRVLQRILEISELDRHSRKDISRSLAALKMFKGKTPNELFKTLSDVKPARYPSIKSFGGNLKLKFKSKRQRS